MSKNNKITKEDAEMLIKGSNGQIFTVTYVKANGLTRTLNGRLGVTKGLTGKGLVFEPSEYDLLTVYDLEKGQYRMVRLETLKKLVIGGHSYQVVL